MSGHSKWANIKRKKAANDKVKGATFAKLSRIITLAVVEGGGLPDPNHNFKLRLAIDKARSYNMPRDNIQRAIDRASGPEKNQLKEVIYEGFAPYGVALLLQATTDNANRTVNEIKNHLEKNGGKLGSQGSVSYIFRKCGLIIFEKLQSEEDAIFAFAEAMDAIDIDTVESSYYVYIPFEFFGKINNHLGSLKPHLTEIDYKPTNLVSVATHDQVRQILSLVDSLEALDDVHKVFSNLEIPDSLEFSTE